MTRLARGLADGGLLAGALAALAVAWSSTGTSPAVIGLWLVTVVLGLLVPGWCIVRVVRGEGRASTDLGWAGPAGLVLALATWVLGHLVGLTLSTPLVGTVIAGGLLALPAARRRIRSEGSSPIRQWGPGVVVAIAASVLVATRWLWRSGLAQVDPVPVDGQSTYPPDLLYQTALTGELRRNLVPGYPMVDGEPLGYHWFFHALAAQLSGSGMHDLDVVTRLLPSTLVVFLILVAGSIGHQVVGHAVGAIGGSASLALLAPVTAESWGPGPFRFLTGYWQASPTATLGWVFGLSAVGCCIAFLRRAADDTLAPAPLLALFVAGAAGAKSAQVPVIVCGIALAAVAWTVGGRKHPDWRPTLVRFVVTLTVLLVLLGLALVFVYPGSYGLRPDPLAWFRQTANAVFGTQVPGVLSVVVASTIYLVRRWLTTMASSLGLVALIRRAPLDPSGWIGIGVLVGGMVASAITSHPSGSQYYFAIAAAPIAIPLSGAGCAWGLRQIWLRAGVVRPHPGRSLVTPAAWAFGALVLSSIGLVGIGGLVYRRRSAPAARDVEADASLGDLLEVLRVWTQPVLLVVGGIAVLATIGWLVLRRGAATAVRGGWGSLVTVGIFAGSTVWLAGFVMPSHDPGDPANAMASQREFGRPDVSRALFDAGQYVRGHAAPTDIIATNRVMNGRTRQGGSDSRDFAVPALTGLRTDVSGYGYAPRMLEEGVRTGRYYVHLPFWDPARLAAEQALVTSPTAQNLADAYRQRGVRWILVDERSGPVSDALRDLTDVVMQQDGVLLARLRPPS